VPCDYVILAARKRGSRVTRMNRPLPPRPEAARDVEPDPLWSAATPVAALLRRSASCGWRNGQRQLALPHSTRLERLALLANKPKRANLYRESKIAALLPRRTEATDPQIDCLLRSAAIFAGE